MKNALAVPAACMLLVLTSCGNRNSMDTETNKPLATAQVPMSTSYERVRSAIWSFSRSNKFAVQEIVTQPRGQLDFSIRLFRADISITINKLSDNPIQLAAFPLCASEINKRNGLQVGADAAIRELKVVLTSS